MSKEASLILLLAIPFAIGLCQVLFPQKCIDLAVKFYGKFGMRIKTNQAIWSTKAMRAIGALYLAFIILIFLAMIKSFNAA